MREQRFRPDARPETRWKWCRRGPDKSAHWYVRTADPRRTLVLERKRPLTSVQTGANDLGTKSRIGQCRPPASSDDDALDAGDLPPNNGDRGGEKLPHAGGPCILRVTCPDRTGRASPIRHVPIALCFGFSVGLLRLCGRSPVRKLLSTALPTIRRS